MLTASLMVNDLSHTSPQPSKPQQPASLLARRTLFISLSIPDPRPSKSYRIFRILIYLPSIDLPKSVAQASIDPQAVHKVTMDKSKSCTRRESSAIGPP